MLHDHVVIDQACRTHCPPLTACHSAQSLNHPAIPRLRDLLYGGSNPTVDLLKQTQPASSAAPQLPDISLLPQWAQRCVRQVPALPSGRHAMYYMLSSVDDLRAKVVACDRSCGVVEAYLQLALVDVVMHCWQERSQELAALELRVHQVSASSGIMIKSRVASRVFICKLSV